MEGHTKDVDGGAINIGDIVLPWTYQEEERPDNNFSDQPFLHIMGGGGNSCDVLGDLGQ